MSSIFRKYQEYNNTPNRNTFDNSFQNNFTTEFGKITPVFFQKCMPGHSGSIRPTFSLHFMPMIFPVQTRMKAYLHFFKVRARTLWKDYKDWYGNTKKNLEKPYINFNSQRKLDKMASTRSLGDYLGLPTVTYGEYSNIEVANSISNPTYPDNRVANQVLFRMLGGDSYHQANDFFDHHFSPGADWPCDRIRIADGTIPNTIAGAAGRYFGLVYDVDVNKIVDSQLETFTFRIALGNSAPLANIQTDSIVLSIVRPLNTDSNGLGEYAFAYKFGPDFSSVSRVDDINYITFNIPVSYLDFEQRNHKILIAYQPYESDSKTVALQNTGGGTTPPVTFLPATIVYNLQNAYRPEELTMETSPWYYEEDVSPNKAFRKKISAEPFRVYEAVYNAFYRNIYNNPYKPNGVDPEYNEYIPSREGAADNHTYDFHYRNWEDDFLTTALQTPQQGDNPVLVGISNPKASTVNPDGTQTYTLALRDENGKAFSIKPIVSDDGQSILSWSYMEDTSNSFEPLTLSNMTTSGISIPDLWNATALQRWLQINGRRGLRFRDTVKGHFDVDIRFDELEMPEFIGGVVKDISMNQITQTVGKNEGRTGSFEDVLGSFAGQAGVYGGTPNDIRWFCDEPCFIIGLLSVVPVPNYSQLLPKYWTDRDILDEYFPEFANIQMQPIKMSEVAPLQVFKDDPSKMDDTFGYQRPWYQYLQRTDEVHGLMRTQLRDFVMNRAFNSAPELGEDFLLVDPGQLNDVFAVTDTTDKIIGQIWFDEPVKQPIPRNGQPRMVDGDI